MYVSDHTIYLQLLELFRIEFDLLRKRYDFFPKFFYTEFSK